MILQEHIVPDEKLALPDLNIKSGDLGYVDAFSIDVIYELSKESLKSQLDGARQIIVRCGTILTQSISLASASTAGIFYAFSDDKLVENLGFNVVLGSSFTALVLWIISAIYAAIGIRATGLSAVGIDITEAFKPNVLSRDARATKLWAITTLAGSHSKGDEASTRLAAILNRAVTLSVAAPIAAVMMGAALYFTAYFRLA